MMLRNLVSNVRAARRRIDEHGAAFAEYGLLLLGIATVVAVSVAALGGRVASLYDIIF
jgi:Flp pilus assembly pilin Flp